MKRLGLLILVAMLGGCSTKPAPVDEKVKAEISAREAYSKRTLLAEDAGGLFGVASRPDIMFEEGFSIVYFNPPDNFRGIAVRWMGQNAHVRLRPSPGRTMKLHIGGWINESMIKTKPFMSVFVDGERIGTIGPIELEHYFFDINIAADKLPQREWIDLNIRTNAVAFHWGEPPALRVAQVYNFDWSETDEPPGPAKSGP